MMRFELGLEQPDPSRAWKSALTIALAYIIGGDGYRRPGLEFFVQGIVSFAH